MTIKECKPWTCGNYLHMSCNLAYEKAGNNLGRCNENSVYTIAPTRNKQIVNRYNK